MHFSSAPQATITNQPRKMDLNPQQPAPPSSNNSNGFHHCHQSAKSKPFHEASSLGIATTLKGHKFKAATGEMNGGGQPGAEVTTTNGHPLSHHHRDALENVMPLNNIVHNSNVNGTLSNSPSQRYCSGQQQNGAMSSNATAIKKDHHHHNFFGTHTTGVLKPKDQQLHEAKDNSTTINGSNDNHSYYNNMVRRVRNRSESLEPSDDAAAGTEREEEAYYMNGRNFKVASAGAPAGNEGQSSGKVAVEDVSYSRINKCTYADPLFILGLTVHSNAE